ncbi:MAG: hypothetical protein ACJ790_10810 [Myxococcaceae bacterium]
MANRGLWVALLITSACGASGTGGSDALTGDSVPKGPGPWPTDSVKDYSASFGLGAPQSVGIDDAHNVWLLDGARIGVLRPGDSAPHWTTGVGQAAGGFGQKQHALGSTVICGGSEGHAYVGYQTYELPNSQLGDVNDPEYQKGDLDLVKVNDDGSIALETHVSESVRYQGAAQNKLGIRNSNDWMFDEDRSVLVCHRLRKGGNRGDLFIGTNHGVTMIRGSVFNSHRHPVWDVNGSLRIGFNFALGSSFDGTQVLIGNEWKLGVLAAPVNLESWDRSDENPWIVDTYNDALNSLSDMDHWRGFTQTKDGSYFLASQNYGLWKMTLGQGQPKFSKVTGIGTDSLGQLQATNDGSLFVATSGKGLWRMDASGAFSRVSDVKGSEVKQLVYEPTVDPAMLMVLTDAGVTVLRGY